MEKEAVKKKEYILGKRHDQKKDENKYQQRATIKNLFHVKKSW